MQPKCPFCKSRNNKKLRQLTYNCVFFCHNCRLGFQYPLLKKNSIKKYYKESIYPQVWGDHTGSFGEMKKITYQWIFKHLGKGRGEKLLDIGTGYGFALLEAKRKGYQPVGIEPSPELSKIASKAHGVKVINDFFENVKFPIESFHLVSMFDSIEHMLNPQASLKKAAALVKPGGFLVITTPDINSLSAKLFYKYWFHLKNEHYYYFNKEILKNLLLKNGFTVKISMGQKRPLTLKYIENHFRIYPIPFLSITFRHLLSLVPTKIKNKIFTIYDGNLFMVAQKSVKIA